MSRVPVLVTTLCRDEHFIRCIESLKRNSYACETELYIGLDYPLKEQHWEGYRKICKYLEDGVEGFLNVTILRQEKNLGSSKNHKATRKLLFEKYGRYIFTEDDNEFSPNFLEFMNVCMDQYNDSDEVVAVSGYMYPADMDGIKGNVLLLDTYFSAFGRGIWKRTDELISSHINMKDFTRMYRNVLMMHRLRRISPNQYTNFVKGMVGYIPELVKDSQILSTDLAYGLYMFFYHKQMVFPIISKVRNWGYDGSGVNCNNQVRTISEDMEYRSYNFSEQKIDEREHFEEKLQWDKESLRDADKRISKFFRIPEREKLVTIITYYVSLVIGCNNMKRIIKKLKK